MADNLTDTFENLVLDWVNSIGTPTRPTAPLKVALITTTTASTDAAAGSEVTGGSYARQNASLSAASSGATSNSVACTFTNMPACTVGGVEIWDSAATPVRIWHGTLASNKVVNVGDTFVIAIGDLDITLG